MAAFNYDKQTPFSICSGVCEWKRSDWSRKILHVCQWSWKGTRQLWCRQMTERHTDRKQLFPVTHFLCLIKCFSSGIVSLLGKSTIHEVPAVTTWKSLGFVVELIVQLLLVLAWKLLCCVDIWQMISTLNRRVSSPFWLFYTKSMRGRMKNNISCTTETKEKSQHDILFLNRGNSCSPGRYLWINIDIIIHATNNKYRPTKTQH